MGVSTDESVNTVRMMRFLMGFFLAASIILIEIGVAQIIISKDNECRQSISGGRIALDPNEVCSSELVGYFLEAFSKGPFAATRAEVSPLQALIVTAGLYGLAGGLAAQFASRRALVIFLGAHVLITVALAILAYLRTFIV